MTFLSYAPNFEDVMLWRALGAATPGFYVDLGAPAPGPGSVTQALHDRGWRGINHAADEAACRRLRARRPLDTTVPPGDVPDLAALCRTHAGGVVHALRVAVDGVHPAAPAAAVRPWIVLATVAGHEEWEPALLAQGYRFAWFDGLSRFYAAAAQHEALAPHFQAPPNLLDGFVRAADLDGLPWVQQAEARAATAEARLDAMRRSMSWRLAAPLRRLVGQPVQPARPTMSALPASRAAFAAGLRFAAVPGVATEAQAERPGLVRALGRAAAPEGSPEVLLCRFGQPRPPWSGLALALAGEDEVAEHGPAGIGAVLAPSAGAAKALVDAGVGVPVRVLPPGPGMADRLAGIAASLLLAPPLLPLSVAWVTTWGVRCGIAEYSRQLLGTLPNPGAILADLRTAPAPGVTPAWTIADADGSAALLAAIQQQDPRAVVVQHQPGLFPWRHFAALLTHPALHGRVVCVVLHNTEALLDIPEAERGLAVSALNAISRVAVHTRRDVERLSALGLARRTVLMPHGAPPHVGPQPVRTLDPAGEAVVGCYGFFLPGKGIPELIEAVSLLRPRWPRLRLRLVNAEYPAPVSVEEIAAARARAEACGVANAVEFETRYEEDAAASTARLRGCDLVVLPYQHSKEASSAALRSVLSTGIPVAATPLAMFEEAEGAVIVLPGMAPGSLADGIGQALLDGAARAATAVRAEAWIRRHSWSAVGQRWTRLLETLLASGVVAG